VVNNYTGIINVLICMNIWYAIMIIMIMCSNY